MHSELLLNCIVYLYFIFGFLGILYVCFHAQTTKSTLLKMNFIVSFLFLFLIISVSIFSDLLTSKNIISNLTSTQFLTLLLIIISFGTPILLAFTYFLLQNIILGWLDEKFYKSRVKDATKLTFLIILSVFSFFILTDFLFEYFLIGVNFRMSFSEKLSSFLFGFCVILSYFYDGKFLIQGIILDQVFKLKKAIYMEFECGVFKENVINEEIGLNTDELQSMIEKYKMTGNRLNKKDKHKMNDLVSKQNLLIHRRKLTNQFVTNKTMILSFLTKTLYILINAGKVFCAMVLIISIGITILRDNYNNDKLFNENPMEFISEIISKFAGAYISLFWANMISVIIVKNLLMAYIICCSKNNFSSEFEPKFVFLEEKEKQIRDVEKELNEVKKYFNLISLVFFAIWISSFLMPKYNLFIPNESCDLILWKQENFVLLKKKCEITFLGEIYLMMMQRKEIKIGIFILNIFFFCRMIVNLFYGFILDGKKASQLKAL